MNPSQTFSPAAFILSAALGIGSVEKQEVEGQRRLEKATELPKKITGATREQLTVLGFSFGNDVDELFVECTLPAGWVKRADPRYALHTDLLDDQGRKRAEIFYKAAEYDRRADLRMLRRFQIDLFQEACPGLHETYYGTYVASVLCEGRGEVFRAGTWVTEPQCDELEALCESWLKEHYPDWKDPLAYWDVVWE